MKKVTIKKGNFKYQKYLCAYSQKNVEKQQDLAAILDKRIVPYKAHQRTKRNKVFTSIEADFWQSSSSGAQSQGTVSSSVQICILL